MMPVALVAAASEPAAQRAAATGKASFYTQKEFGAGYALAEREKPRSAPPQMAEMTKVEALAGTG